MDQEFKVKFTFSEISYQTKNKPSLIQLKELNSVKIILEMVKDRYLFISTKRGFTSAFLALVLEIYVFNFVGSDAAIIAARTLPRQILDYVFNFVVFFVFFYLAITFFDCLVKGVRKCLKKD